MNSNSNKYFHWFNINHFFMTQDLLRIYSNTNTMKKGEWLCLPCKQTITNSLFIKQHYPLSVVADILKWISYWVSLPGIQVKLKLLTALIISIPRVSMQKQDLCQHPFLLLWLLLSCQRTCRLLQLLPQMSSKQRKWL